MNIKFLNKNTKYSALQTIVLALSAFILFRFCITQLGLDITGIWSFLSSIATITSFGSFGFSNALFHYIPKYKINEPNSKLNELVNTSLLAVFFSTLLLCLIAYLIFTYLIPFTLDKKNISTANSLLPLIISSLLLSSISSVYISTLDGLQLMFIRSKINIIGAFLFLICMFFLVTSIGVIGIPIAQLIQYVFIVIAAYFATKKNIPSYKLRFRINKEILRDIYKYGFNFQIISITQMFSDPYIKFIITKYTGPGNTAIFDFIMKILGIGRSLIISTTQTIIPQITTLYFQKRYGIINTYYKKNIKLILVSSILFYLFPLLLSELVNKIIFHESTLNFNFIFINVAIAFFINSLALPAYFQYLGIGKLKWLIYSNLLSSILMVVICSLISYINSQYIILGWSISSIIGSISLIIAYQKEFVVKKIGLFDRKNLIIIISLISYLLISQYLRLTFYINDIVSYAANIIMFIFLTILLILNNINLLIHKKK